MLHQGKAGRVQRQFDKGMLCKTTSECLLAMRRPAQAGIRWSFYTTEKEGREFILILAGA
jgi:hypothetical protein